MHKIDLTVLFNYLFIYSLFTGLLSTPLEVSMHFLKHDRYQLDVIANECTSIPIKNSVPIEKSFTLKKT